jgi:uncharacterized protein
MGKAAATDHETGEVCVLDSGPQAHGLQRMCVATRTVQPVSDLIRFVIGPDGEAVPDLKARLPGRGVWVTGTQVALADAMRRKALARGFGKQVRLPADLPAQTEKLLERSVLDALGMAAKAGLVAAGFAKVETALAQKALARKNVAALLHATEAAPDGVRKLDAAMRRRQGGGPIAVIGTLSGAQLDLALGRPSVIHAALLAGPPTDTFLARLRRLERFRTGDRELSGGREH